MANAFRALLETIIVLALVFGACILAADLIYGPSTEHTPTISLARR